MLASFRCPLHLFEHRCLSITSSLGREGGTLSLHAVRQRSQREQYHAAVHVVPKCIAHCPQHWSSGGAIQRSIKSSATHRRATCGGALCTVFDAGARRAHVPSLASAIFQLESDEGAAQQVMLPARGGGRQRRGGSSVTAVATLQPIANGWPWRMLLVSEHATYRRIGSGT